MQILVDGIPEPRISMTCSGCAYLSHLGRCQRIKSKFYAQKISFPDDFACARWERFGVKASSSNS